MKQAELHIFSHSAYISCSPLYSLDVTVYLLQVKSPRCKLNFNFNFIKNPPCMKIFTCDINFNVVKISWPGC
jgi:hypothetical protein